VRGAISLGAIGVLGYRGQAIVVLTPSLFPCRIDLWPERGFDEVVWELPTSGPGHPSFRLGPAVGQAIKSV
jgi:hypothetical protein